MREDRSGPGAAQQVLQMCPIDADFKHFRCSKAKDFQHRRKLSSIMCAKLLSIMPTSDPRLTSLFKPIRMRPSYGLSHRPGT
jgi:hypothetical protein